VINAAQYYPGCQEFFQKLNRSEYIPILISGGIKQFSSRACTELGIDEKNSYTSCSYYFSNGKLDIDLALINTSNFYGKHELVKVALRKYGLGENDWIFIGDGPNDVSVAQKAPVSIGISPLPELQAVVDYTFNDFSAFKIPS
jgi:phosphoserine phosphatase